MSIDLNTKEIIYIVGGILFFILEIAGMAFSNSIFKTRYKYSLYGGGVLVLLGEIVIVLAAFCLYEGKMYGIALILLGLIAIGFVGFYNVKKTGNIKVGIGALIIQIIFSIGSPFETMVLFKRRNGRNNAQDNLNAEQNPFVCDQNNENEHNENL